MFNIREFAKDIAGGTFDHILPREADRAALTMRQIAAQYPVIAENAGDDAGHATTTVALSVTAVLEVVFVTWSIVQGHTPEKVVIPILAMALGLFLTTGLLTFPFITRWGKYSSQKLKRAQEARLAELESDLNKFARHLHFGGYMALAGYDRKTLAAMALDAGATMAVAIRKTMNSDDIDERQLSAEVSQRLDAFHALLCRLDLQPKGGYPAYGRRAAEPAEVVAEAA